MATKLTEGKHPGEFILWEAGNISREKVTIASGENLVAGTVLGKVTSSGEYKLHNAGAGTGEQDAVALLFDNVDASGGAVEATIIARLAEVSLAALTFKSGISAGDKTTAIAKLAADGRNIIVRQP